jgi:hypothetical protein
VRVGWRLNERYQHYWKVKSSKEKTETETHRLRLRFRSRRRRRLRSRRTEFRLRKASNLKAGRASPLTSRPKADLLVQQYLASRPAVKLFVREEGWYRVTQSELVAAGLSPKANPRFLQLFVDGREQPIKVIGKGLKFDAIEFYGIGLDTPSTDTRVYWLIEGFRPGKRIREFKSYSGSLGSLGVRSVTHTQ